MKKIYFFMICLFFFSSCLTSNVNDIVLKKSAKDIPVWLNENGKVNADHPDFVNVIFNKSDLYNLPLGLKQSQAIASKKISNLVFTEIQKQILMRYEKINDKKKPHINELSKGLSHIIKEKLSDFKIEPPLASEIYWEYRQQENSHDESYYYVVWVLLLIPKTVYDKAFLTIARELQNSKEESIVILGNDILQQPEKR